MYNGFVPCMQCFSSSLHSMQSHIQHPTYSKWLGSSALMLSILHNYVAVKNSFRLTVPRTSMPDLAKTMTVCKAL